MFRPVLSRLRFRAPAYPSAGAERRQDTIKYAGCLLPALPFGRGAQQVFFCNHLQNGPDVLRHAAVDQHEALLKFFARCSGGVLFI